DEVLAVGDLAFQRKCLGKMGSVAGEGRTVILVSHNMAAIRMLTQDALWLDHGRLAASGPTEPVVRQYLATVFTDRSPYSDLSAPGLRASVSKPLARDLLFTSASLRDGGGQPAVTF